MLCSFCPVTTSIVTQFGLTLSPQGISNNDSVIKLNQIDMYEDVYNEISVFFTSMKHLTNMNWLRKFLVIKENVFLLGEVSQ